MTIHQSMYYNRWVTPVFLLFLCALLCTRDVLGAYLTVLPGPYRSGKAFVPVAFDSNKQICLLDTGSAMTLLRESPHLAAYTNSGKISFKSAADTKMQMTTIRIQSAQIDQASFTNINVARMPADTGIESALGMDLLSRQPFSLNFHDSPSLLINPKPPQKLQVGLQVETHGLFTLPLVLGHKPILAMFDTGSSVTAVDQQFVQENPGLFNPTDDFLTGTDGTGTTLLVKSYRASRITIGHRTFRNLRVVALDLSMLRKSLNPELQVVIGFNVIRKTDWYFDPHQLIWSIR